MRQTAAFESAKRVRAFGYFILAAIYFFFAQMIAGRAANGFAAGDWSEVIARAMLLFLLLVGYGAMGKAFNRQRKPIEAMGLVFRPTAKEEFGVGAALGWGMMIAAILPMVLWGGLIVSFWTSAHQFWLLLLDLIALALASLAEEVAFRGYPFQRLIEAMGPTMATLCLSLLFGAIHIANPNSSRASVIVTVFAGWLLSIGYLRTRGLWFSWGWHFTWNATMAVLFGLPLSGLTRFSPVIQSNTIGPLWITGGDYGPEGSFVTGWVLLAGVIVLFRITRKYARLYAEPVIVPGGIPVDLDAMSHVLAPHHPREPIAAEKLVQIASFQPADQAEAPRKSISSEARPIAPAYPVESGVDPESPDSAAGPSLGAAVPPPGS